MSMYDLDETESKYKQYAEWLSKAEEEESQKEKDFFESLHTPLEERLDSLTEYLDSKNSVYNNYLNLLQRVINHSNIRQKIVYTKKKTDCENEHKEFVQLLLKPMSDISSGVKSSSYFSENEKKLAIANEIIYRLNTIDSMKENNPFSKEEYSSISKKIQKIYLEICRIPSEKEKISRKIRKYQENFSGKNNKKIQSLLSLNNYGYLEVTKILEDSLDFVEKTSEEENEIIREIREEYSYRNIKIEEDHYMSYYKHLSQSTKEQYKIKAIDMDDYREMLYKKAILKKILDGLNKAKTNLGSITFVEKDEKNQASIVIALINSAITDITKIQKENDIKIAEIENYKEAIKQAYETQYILVEELAELLFKRRIYEDYDEKRLEELYTIVNGPGKEKSENLKRAEKLCEEKYIEYNNKKALEEMKDSPSISLDEAADLYRKSNDDLIIELTQLAGEEKVREIKEWVNYKAEQQYSFMLDESRAPFDFYDLNLGNQNEFAKKLLRKTLIDNIKRYRSERKQKEIEERKAYEQGEIPTTSTDEKASEDTQDIDEEKFLMIAEILKKVKEGSPVSKYRIKIYEDELYLAYNLPYVDTSDLTEKEISILQSILTEEEITETEQELKENMVLFIRECLNKRIINPKNSPRPQKMIQQVFRDLYPAAIVKRAIQKYKEITLKLGGNPDGFHM